MTLNGRDGVHISCSLKNLYKMKKCEGWCLSITIQLLYNCTLSVNSITISSSDESTAWWTSTTVSGRKVDRGRRTGRLSTGGRVWGNGVEHLASNPSHQVGVSEKVEEFALIEN